MMFLCEYELHPGRGPEEIERRARELHQAGASHQDLIETWYSYPNEGAGFMVLHAADMVELNEVLDAYRDFVRFQAKPVLEEVIYEERVGVGRPSRDLAPAS